MQECHVNFLVFRESIVEENFAEHCKKVSSLMHEVDLIKMKGALSKE